MRASIRAVAASGVALVGVVILAASGSTSSKASTGTVPPATGGTGTVAPAGTTPATAASSPTTSNPLPHDKDFEVQSVSFKDDGLGDFGGAARVTNTSTKSLTATFKFTVLQPGTQNVVATLEGTADSVAPGQTVTVDLISQDPYKPGYTTYQFQVDAEF